MTYSVARHGSYTVSQVRVCGGGGGGGSIGFTCPVAGKNSTAASEGERQVSDHACNTRHDTTRHARYRGRRGTKQKVSQRTYFPFKLFRNQTWQTRHGHAVLVQGKLGAQP